MGSATITPIHKQEGKKKLVRRSISDSSQRIRRIVQWLFVALNGWLGIQFLLWVRFCERGGTGLSRAKTRRGRRLAAHRRFDEYEIFLPHRTRACNPSRSNGLVHCLHADEPPTQEGLLFLALPQSELSQNKSGSSEDAYSAAICIRQNGWISRYGG